MFSTLILEETKLSYNIFIYTILITTPFHHPCLCEVLLHRGAHKHLFEHIIEATKNMMAHEFAKNARQFIHNVDKYALFTYLYPIIIY